MKKVIGNSFLEIDNLKVDDNCMVILPGPTIENPTVNEMEKHFNDLKTNVLNYGISSGRKFTVDINMYGGACVSLYRFSFRALVSQSLLELDENDLDYTVEIPKPGGSRSGKSTIYSVAQHLKLKVSVEEFDNTYEVGLRTKRSLATVKRKNVSSTLNRWVFFLPYDTPTLIPEEIRQDMSDVYIRTVINKSKFMLSYTKLKITKHTYKLCNRNNGVEVRTTDKPLARIPSIRINQLTDEHRAHLNLQLMPYGVRVVGVDVVTV